jgi:hypothetical protein
MMRQLIVQLLAVIQHQAAQIAALEARLSQTSRNSDRPPSSDPRYATRPARSGEKGHPGAKPGVSVQSVQIVPISWLCQINNFDGYKIHLPK